MRDALPPQAPRSARGRCSAATVSSVTTATRWRRSSGAISAPARSIRPGADPHLIGPRAQARPAPYSASLSFQHVGPRLQRLDAPGRPCLRPNSSAALSTDQIGLRVDRQRAPRKARAAFRAGWRCAAGGAWSCGGPAATAGPDRRAARPRRPTSWISARFGLGQEGAAAGGQHARRAAQQAGEHLGLAGAEEGLAVALEDLGDGAVGGADDLFVRNRGTARPAGGQARCRRRSCPPPSCPPSPRFSSARHRHRSRPGPGQDLPTGNLRSSMA